MKISIIIPVYNGENHITARMAELLNYNNPEAEIIFVDDGSTDNSFDRFRDCQAVNKWDTRITMTGYSNNRGSLYARKFGVNQAKHDLIYMTDIDDPLSLSYLEGLQFDIEGSLERTMIPIPKQIFVDGKPNGQVWHLQQFDDPERYIVELLIRQSGQIPINNTIFQKETLLAAMNETDKLLNAIGVKRMDYGEDSLTANVMIKEKLIEHIKPSTIYSVPYTIDNSGSVSKDEAKRMKDMPILIAHAYYMMYSQFGEGEESEAMEFKVSFENILHAKYGDNSAEFSCTVADYVHKIKEYYENKM